MRRRRNREQGRGLISSSFTHDFHHSSSFLADFDLFLPYIDSLFLSSIKSRSILLDLASPIFLQIWITMPAVTLVRIYIYIFDPLSWREIDKSGFSSKKGVDIFDLGRSMEKESWLVFSLTIPKSLRPPWFKRNAGRRERSGGEECVRHRPFAYVTNPSNRSDLWTLLSPIDP